MHDDNPYAPPSATSLDDGTTTVDARWYLTRVQKYFRRMAIAGLIYTGVLILITIATQLRSETLQNPETAGTLVWSAFLAWLFITMIRIGRLPEDEFPKHYKKARWVVILVGTIFLPILGLPAIISLRRLSRYNAIQSNRL